MILCTNCGTKNPDDLHECANCRRKLQSRRAMGAAPGNGQNGGQSGGPGMSAERPWVALAPLLRTVDEQAARMVKATAEIWTYAALLIGSAIATAWTQQWWYAALGMALAAGLARLRGL